MKYIFTQLYSSLRMARFLLITGLVLVSTMGFAQLVPNTYTPITSASGLNPVLSANDETCNLLLLDLVCVENLGNMDGNLNSAATMNSLLSSPLTIQVQFNETAPAG